MNGAARDIADAGQRRPKAAQTAHPMHTAIGPLFGEIASLAEAVRVLLIDCGDGGNPLDTPLRALVCQIGALADQSAVAFGAPSMNGSFEEWLLSPDARDALATVRGAA